MGRLMVVALRTVLVMTLAGTVVVQVMIVPLMAIDLEEADPDVAHLQIPFAVLAILAVAAAQVALVCVWRLVTMVRRGTLFSPAAFRYVDVVIGAAAAAALLTFAVAVVLSPGEAVPPGMVLLVCGAALVAAGIGLIVLVMRSLLAQAIARETEAFDLRAELAEVI